MCVSQPGAERRRSDDTRFYFYPSPRELEWGLCRKQCRAVIGCQVLQGSPGDLPPGERRWIRLLGAELQAWTRPWFIISAQRHLTDNNRAEVKMGRTSPICRNLSNNVPQCKIAKVRPCRVHSITRSLRDSGETSQHLYRLLMSGR